MSRLYVHCGLHKTGTTAIQRFMRDNAQTLAGVGICYPQAGRPGRSGGHHNLAWQLTGDSRFDPRWGDLDTLAHELAGLDGDVVLSSEDFESLLVAPAKLRPLAQLAADSGRTLTGVVYLRNQVDYLESIYLQCVRAGLGDAFEPFAREAVERGEVRREGWTFLFDFARGLDNLAGLGCEVKVRNYHALEGGSAIRDFLGVIGAPQDLFSADELAARHHERDRLLYLLAQFYHNRIGRRLSLPEQKAVVMLGEDLAAAAAPRSAEARLADAFVMANGRVCDRFDVDGKGLAQPQPRRAGSTPADLAKVFSVDTHQTIARLAQMLDAPGLEAQATARAKAWRAWLTAGEPAQDLVNPLV